MTSNHTRVLCVVPDDKRIIKTKTQIQIKTEYILDSKRLKVIEHIVQRIRAGDEISMINLKEKLVYKATVKLAIDTADGITIYTEKLLKCSRLKHVRIDSLIFETSAESLIGVTKHENVKNRRYYKHKEKDIYKGYRMRGLRKTNKKEAYEREQAWLARLDNNNLYTGPIDGRI